jgi:hypothetical protein
MNYFPRLAGLHNMGQALFFGFDESAENSPA